MTLQQFVEQHIAPRGVGGCGQGSSSRGSGGQGPGAAGEGGQAASDLAMQPQGAGKEQRQAAQQGAAEEAQAQRQAEQQEAAEPAPHQQPGQQGGPAGRGYLAQHPLFDQIPALAADIRVSTCAPVPSACVCRCPGCALPPVLAAPDCPSCSSPAGPGACSLHSNPVAVPTWTPCPLCLPLHLQEPPYCVLGEGEVQSINAWLGPPSTVSCWPGPACVMCHSTATLPAHTCVCPSARRNTDCSGIAAVSSPSAFPPTVCRSPRCIQTPTPTCCARRQGASTSACTPLHTPRVRLASFAAVRAAAQPVRSTAVPAAAA